MRPTLSCPLGTQLSSRSRWAGRPQARLSCGMNLNPTIILGLTSTFPSFLYSTERVGDKATKADHGSSGREPRGYLSLLIPLQAFGAGDTWEDIGRGCRGHSGTWPSQATLWSTVHWVPWTFQWHLKKTLDLKKLLSCPGRGRRQVEWNLNQYPKVKR